MIDRNQKLSQALGLVIVAIPILLLFFGCETNKQPFDLSQATYVGREQCVECHRDQSAKWVGSHHDKAMQLATDETVLGDFSDTELTHQGITSRMFRDGKRFMVYTEGPDGQLSNFEVKYVFGFTPLQQFMVEFPAIAEDEQTLDLDQTLPRVQVLRLCWDTLKKKWFYLDPPDVSDRLDPQDDLHWTGVAQRWNTMCAECHSTDYQKGFKPPNSAQLVSSKVGGAESPNAPTAAKPSAFMGEYHSSFVEINVSCEACHGPGSEHIKLAKKTFPGWSRQRGYGLANLKLSPENQIQACAPCHSRRNVVHGGFKAGDNYYDFYTDELLSETVYYPDGQVLDEDYIHGSFIQSKMYHKGIKCTDCHDPHTAKLKHDGNQVCTSCHQHPTAKYDSVAHHFHKPDSPGAQCVNCHMPSTTYMAVDPRRDHSLRIPRPDLSLQIGTPNACTGCHLKLENVSEPMREKLNLYQDWMQAARDGNEEVKAELRRADQYCDQWCDKWYKENRRRDQHFGLALAAGQRGDENAEQLLKQVLSRTGHESPAIARATALQLLSNLSPRSAANEAVKAISDEHPLVRAAATSALVGSDSTSQSVSLLEKALSDPVRCVRTEAARNLLLFPPNDRPSMELRFRSAVNELETGLQYNNDRAGSHLALGICAEQLGQIEKAIKHYEQAIAVEPRTTGPRTNLAALLERQLSGNVSSKQREGLQAEVDRLRAEELPLLERDVQLLPQAAAIRYRFGLALYLAGRMQEASEQLVKAAELAPQQADFAHTAALLLEKMARWDEAIYWAQEAVKRSKNSPENQRLLQSIKTGAGK